MSVHVFAAGKNMRDARCANKDKVIVPMIEKLRICNPDKFNAVLMPCLDGPELDILRSKGVPARNIWAIEADPDVYAKMKKSLPVNMPPKPLRSYEAIMHIRAEMADRGSKCGLMYLDYFGQPHAEHVRLLRHVFMLGMLDDNGTLILNFGRNRCSDYVARINGKLKSEHRVPVKEYVDAVIEQCRQRGATVQPYAYSERSYRSQSRGQDDEHTYVTSRFEFGR
jgi:hypothetical protein